MNTAIKERPILFTGPMVRAILDGRKTQTRRIVKLTEGLPDAEWVVARAGYWSLKREMSKDHPDYGKRLSCNTICVEHVKCPYGEPGEQLWVRESFCADFKPMIYQATANYSTYGGERVKYKPSIHMPRHLSRIDLEITGVRVERLNEISQEDAVAEGVDGRLSNNDGSPCDSLGISAKRQYQTLWESINGLGSWAANPWVWVVDFKAL